VPQRQLPLAYGLGGIEKRFVDVLGGQVRMLRRISSVVIPSATIATTVATGKRSPAMHGRPAMTSGSVVMRSQVTRPC